MTPSGTWIDATLLRTPWLPQRQHAQYHGGAFALGWASLHYKSCQRYAIEAECMVLLVDYRLGPSRPFPQGFEDCYLAFQWARQNGAGLGADPERIVVMGDSAGGALSAGVAQRALDEGMFAGIGVDRRQRVFGGSRQAAAPKRGEGKRLLAGGGVEKRRKVSVWCSHPATFRNTSREHLGGGWELSQTTFCQCS